MSLACASYVYFGIRNFTWLSPVYYEHSLPFSKPLQCLVLLASARCLVNLKATSEPGWLLVLCIYRNKPEVVVMVVGRGTRELELFQIPFLHEGHAVGTARGTGFAYNLRDMKTD